jgi:hypothetical protein
MMARLNMKERDGKHPLVLAHISAARMIGPLFAEGLGRTDIGGGFDNPDRLV